MLARWMARQLKQPSGLIGRLVLPRLFNRRNAALNDLTLECLELRLDDRVLEVGCGGGYLLGRIAAVVTAGWIAGVDLSPEMVAHSRRRHRRLMEQGRLEIRRATAEALPYPDGTFSRACTVNTIFYLPDAPGAVTELGRVLVEGGLTVICFTRQEDLEDRPFARQGLSLFRPEEVLEMMAEARFGNLRTVERSDRWRTFFCAVGQKQG